MITREQALNLHSRAELHCGECKHIISARGAERFKSEVWRVNGACKTLKRQPDVFVLPIKYGFKGPYMYVTDANASEWHVASECKPTIVNVDKLR